MKNTLLIALMMALSASTTLLAQTLDGPLPDLENIDLGDFDIDAYGRAEEKGYHIKGKLSEGLVYAEKDDKYGFLDKDLEVAIPFVYKNAKRFKNGVAWVEKSSGWGIIDKTGKELSAFVYSAVNDFYEGLAAVFKGSKCGFINMQGELVIPANLERVGNFHEGFAWALRKTDKVLGKQHCYINKAGEMVTVEQFDVATDFSEGLAAVGFGEGKNADNLVWNYIDTKGKFIMDDDYDEAGSFNKGEAIVKKDGKTMTIDKTGKCLKGCE